MKRYFLSGLFVWCCSGAGLAQTAETRASVPAPALRSLFEVSNQSVPSSGTSINLRMHIPASTDKQERAAIVLFHGGGWTEGEAAWMDGLAQQLAAQGMVAVAVEYRLSVAGVTPFDAVADARAAMRWVRREAARLYVDPQRIVALGTSAGAHLAAATAVFEEAGADEISAMPNALILRSPAISLSQSAWFRQLAGGAAQAAALSPDLHLRRGLPPSLLLQGELDTVTPASGAENFCRKMLALANPCQLKLYPGVGHLFTRNLAQQENPDYRAIDQQVSQDAMQTTLTFLRELGFIAKPGKGAQ